VREEMFDVFLFWRRFDRRGRATVIDGRGNVDSM
jgi:hypothetical protein